MANNNGERGHPCRMPECMSKPGCLTPPAMSWQRLSRYRTSTNRVSQSGRSSARSASVKKRWATLGKAALKSKKIARALFCCRAAFIMAWSISTTLDIMDLPGRNPC